MIRATHPGTIDLGQGPLVCYVLEDGTAVLVAEQIQGLLGSAKDGKLARSLARLAKDSDDLNVRPIPFHAGKAGEAIGYTSEDVVKILRAYQRAFIRGALHPKQVPMAMAAMAAIEAFADVGLRALIDRATGYERSLSEMEGRFGRGLRDSMALWEQCFDAEWDRMLCDLYGYQYTGHPPLFAKGINAMVYRFAFGEDVHAELRARNPNPKKRSNHHQLLTSEARILLSQTISNVKNVIRLSRGPRDFVRKLSVLYKDAPLQLELQ